MNMKVKHALHILTAFLVASLCGARADSSMNEAVGQIETYEAVLAARDGRANLARLMVIAHRKAAEASRESVDSIPDRRLADLVKTFSGTPLAGDLEGDPASVRETLKNLITMEERIVAETITGSMERMSDEQARAVLGRVKSEIAQELAQNFSVGDALKKVVSVIAKGVGAGAFLIGSAVRFPVVFSYHFIRNAASVGVQEAGQAIGSDSEAFRKTVFWRYLEWIGKKLADEGESWEDFVKRWRREVPPGLDE